MMKTEKVKTSKVFKDMNKKATAVNQGKKLAVGIKTEAFGDKENVVKKTKISYETGDALKLPELGESTKEKIKSTEFEESTKEKTKSLELVEITKEKKKTNDEPNDIVKKITAEDLTSSNPGEIFWKTLAEKRRVALQEALEENSTLHAKISLLEEENSTLKEALAEATDVIDVLNEIVNEKSEAGDESRESCDRERNIEEKREKEKSPVKAFEDDTILDESDSSEN